MVDFEELRKIKFNELKTQKLTKVYDDFYSKIQEESENYSDERVKINYLNNYEDTKTIRLLKILTMTVRKNPDFDSMTPEEKELYEKVSKNLEEFQPRKQLKTTKTNKIRVLIDIPVFRGLDGNEYGPFDKGQEIELPSNEKQLLLVRNAAQALD
ncbi:Uncharacterised protein [uncultured archaeon]|nr:Uncharacterised protein [uncultured archaeon]